MKFVSKPTSLITRLATLAAVLLFSIALAGPRTPDAETKVSREGIAIMMVVDHSGSMQARDLVKVQCCCSGASRLCGNVFGLAQVTEFATALGHERDDQNKENC